MIIGNRFALPSIFLRAVEAQAVNKKAGTMRVTELIGSPYQKKLMKDVDYIDASEYIPRLLGTAVHEYIEQFVEDEEIEKEFTCTIDGVNISGTHDYYYDGVLGDWKTATVNRAIDDVPFEYEAQLNIYAYQRELADYSIRALKLWYIPKDFSIMRAQGGNYPPIQFVEKDVDLWPMRKTIDYIRQRLAAHQSEPDCCTDEERWKSPDTWAVMVNGQTRASRVCATEADARKFIEEMPEKKQQISYIEHRKGDCIKCKYFCEARAICPHAPEDVHLL
jgi:hypothetical protein